MMIDTVSCLQYASKLDRHYFNNRLTSLSDLSLEFICQLLYDLTCSRVYLST
jgi:hypothetical protein